MRCCLIFVKFKGSDNSAFAVIISAIEEPYEASSKRPQPATWRISEGQDRYALRWDDDAVEQRTDAIEAVSQIHKRFHKQGSGVGRGVAAISFQPSCRPRDVWAFFLSPDVCDRPPPFSPVAAGHPGKHFPAIFLFRSRLCAW